EFDHVRIFDLLTVNIGENWGALVQSAIKCGPKDRYRLMFQFAPIAFSADVNLDLLRAILSFAIIPALKTLAHPKYPSYLRFRADELPDAKILAGLMNDARKPARPDRPAPDRA